MLANIQFKYMSMEEKELVDRILGIASGGDNSIKNPFTGVYILNHHNFDWLIANIVKEYPDIDDDELYCYGVCDTIDQWMEKYYESVIQSPRKFCVAFTKVRKVDQPADGGWRWNKWGSYIGSKTPQHEYLYDEVDIDEVYCYHVVEIL